MSLLPELKTPPQVTLDRQVVLVWGAEKVGKSSFCAQSEDALFLATEAGLNHLNVFQMPLNSWEDMLEACAEISEGKHNFKTIVIDTVDNCFLLCQDYVCREHGATHPSDLPYGKGYALVLAEFSRVLTKLSLLSYGLFLVSHSQDKEITKRTEKYTKQVPTLPEKVCRVVMRMCDLILFVDFEEKAVKSGEIAQRRVIRTKPSKYYQAGDRTGRLPEVLDLDYGAFLVAYEKAAREAEEGIQAEPAGAIEEAAAAEKATPEKRAGRSGGKEPTIARDDTGTTGKTDEIKEDNHE